MNLNFSTTHSILIAIPDNWREEVRKILEDQHYSTWLTASKDEVCTLISSREWQGLIITSDWALDDTEIARALEGVWGRSPTVTLIKAETFQRHGQEYVFGKVFQPSRSQEFCTIPFDRDELIVRLRLALRAAEKGSRQ